MAELVRVSRDGSTIIARVGDTYFTATSTERLASAETLSGLTSAGSWRRPLKAEASKFADALTFASGGVVASAPGTPSRTYRVPPTVKRSIADALENFSSLLSDSDREVATRLATRTSVSKSDIEWMHRFYANIEKAFALHGGKRGQGWAAKVLSSEEEDSLVASVSEFDPEASDLVFFAGGDDPNSTEVDTLYAVDFGDDQTGDSVPTLYVWEAGVGFTPSETGIDELDRAQLIELDNESARALAEHLDGDVNNSDHEIAPFELQNINPLERNLFELAEADLDWEAIDRLSAIIADATGYSPAERAQNAQRQPRQQGGKFGGAPAPVGDTLQVNLKARLPEGVEPVEDINALLDEYLGSSDTTPSEEPKPKPDAVVAAGLPETEKEPLYLAVVDPVDNTAVLDAIAIVPDAENKPTAWVRQDGEWTAAPEMIDDLRGVTPPTVVQLQNEDMIKNVLGQIDEHDGAEDAGGPQTEEAVAASAYEFLSAKTRAGRERAAKRGLALPDGSFPIANESDLKKAVKAFGRAKDQAAAKRHIKKRARALNRTDLLPDTWSLQELFDDSNLSPLYGPHGELIMSVMASGVPGISDTPSDAASVERLKKYWTTGEGAAKIRWGTEGDLTRCHKHLTKYVGPERAWGLCQNLHKRVFGVSNATHDKAAGQ